LRFGNIQLHPGSSDAEKKLGTLQTYAGNPLMVRLEPPETQAAQNCCAGVRKGTAWRPKRFSTQSTAKGVDIKKVAISGAGTIGHALALVHALGACEVRLHDIHQAALDNAMARLKQAFHTLQEAGCINAGYVEVADLPITITTNLEESVEDANIFIEAAAEDLDIKKHIFTEADRWCLEDCIFTSTTSMLNVFPVVPLRRQQRFCVVHWYSPPYIIDLVEVAPGPETSPAVANELCELYARMGKYPILFSSFFPGYVANRVQSAITREVMDILDEGLATPAQIDDSLRHGLALRMAMLGHLMRSDFTSLKLVAANLVTMADRVELPDSTLLHKLVSLGHDGVSTGKGFFDYAGRSPAELYLERDRKLIALKRAFHSIEPIEAAPFTPI
jgi:3-hydroxybutyryl-CoA dehydrogenase